VTDVAAELVPAATRDYQLSERYGSSTATVVLTGTQALTRVLLERRRRDEAAGLRTAGLASGYPGSPLGGLDLALHKAKSELEAEGIRHVPGINEELGAAVVFGTQQAPPGGYRDGLQGVFGMWYGKSPGVDRSGDAFKHANGLGAHPFGGVIAVAGDDPAAKSSSLPNQSETAFFDAVMPVLVAGNTQELLDYGVTGIELSRYCGCWVGLKVVTNIADSVGSVDLDPARLTLVRPEIEIDGVPWRHQQIVSSANLLIDRERDLLERRLHAAKAFAVANRLNRIDGARAGARIGIIAAGKTYYDAREALGLTGDQLDAAGIRLLKLGMIYPLEPGIVQEFAAGLDTILVIEEKRDFVEAAVRNVLYDSPHRPVVIGKRAADGTLLIPTFGELTADRLKPLIDQVLGRTTPAPPRPPAPLTMLSRTSAYCSGCPHNRSTVLPEGAVMGGGVGCHGMSYMDARLASNPKIGAVPMGSEGVPWIGMSPFANTTHMFQNLGDGTYTHSGLLAVRACVAAGVNITYKVLFNGYVAMTGGQQIAGGMTVPAMTRQLHAEGVARVVVVADDVSRYRGVRDLAPGTKVYPRDELESVQLELQTVPGVSVLVYDSVCAAEARRLRRVGKLPARPKKVVINELVCEGCGDCGVKSNCLSVQPVDTELGRKTQIHQTSCNTDYSCLAGDCPSFVTVRTSSGPVKSKRKSAATPGVVPAEPLDKAVVGALPYGIYMVGIGGTGVVTVNQILATAAVIDGRYTAGLDQTGMSQTAGAVVSHLQIGLQPIENRSAAVANAEADLYLVFDLLSGAGDLHLARVRPGRTTAIVAAGVTPTAAVVADISKSLPSTDTLLERVRGAAGAQRTVALDAAGVAQTLFGSEVSANVLLLGLAYQRGAIPLSASAIEQAIRLNGVAVEQNIEAFRAGRRQVSDPLTADRAPATRLGAAPVRPSDSALVTARGLLGDRPLPAEVVMWAAELIDYQNVGLARRYLEAIGAVAARADDVDLIGTFAKHLYRLTAYKDEYEVARLHLKVDIQAQAQESFGGAVQVRYLLHPPILRAMGLKHKLAFGPWIRPGFRALQSLRRLRGTALDPFGYATVRRVERTLPAEYHDAVLAALSDPAATKDSVGATVDAADIVRGYEQIKLDNVDRFRALIHPAVAAR
jgi:indolepyruvate ferredoxin oxidoreductase